MLAAAAAAAAVLSARRGRCGAGGSLLVRHAKQFKLGNRRFSPKQDNLIELQIPEVPAEHWMSPGEANLAHIRTLQVEALNNVMKQQHKKARKRHVVPKLEFGPRPDNPWRDRYMLCGDCERAQDYRNALPKTSCSCSTLLELDMTAPWSRDNVMAVSCEMAQMIREDVWVRRDEEGNLRKVEGKHKVHGSFPVQVCAVCRKSSLDEGRRFRMCATCEGVSYCSDECYAQDRMRHKAHCTQPCLPERKEWGVRKTLRSMRGEIYPMIKTWAIRDPAEHRIAWLPLPKRQDAGLLDGETAIRPALPGFRRQEHLLPTPASSSMEVKDGRVAIEVQPQSYYLRRPRPVRAVEPDDSQLLNLGMTREEFMRRDAELWRKAAREDQELALVAAAAPQAAPVPMLARQPAIRGLGPRKDAGPRLSADAVDRVERAAEEAPDEPPALPPWEELAEEEKHSQVRNTFANGLRKVAEGSSSSPRKSGVVPRDSPVESIAKKRGLVLSPDALARLEAAAEEGKKEENKGGWADPQGPPPMREWSEYNPPQRAFQN